MSVEVTFIGRLGNNLFQYALGRIIAEHHNLELTCVDSWGAPVLFMGNEVDLGPPATLGALSEHFPNAPLSLPGRRISEPVESIEITTVQGWNGQRIDLEAILGNSTPRRIQLAGYFQRYEYFSPFREKLRQWFRPIPGAAPFPIDPRDVLINIRRGRDYEVRDWTLPMEYYQRALSDMTDIGRVYVCGTCIDDRVRKAMERYSPTYCDGTPLEHFVLMTSFRRLILSNSTFAWWGAFLSDAEEIYAPRSESGSTFALTGFGDVDLHMHDPRYREVSTSGISTLALPVLGRARSVRPNVDQDALVVDYTDGTSADIHVDPANLHWINHVLQMKGRLTLAELRNNFAGTDLSAFIEQLVRLEIISQEPIYLE